MGLTEQQMLDYLAESDLSESSKNAICKLISENNKQIQKEIPDIASKGILKAGKKIGR